MAAEASTENLGTYAVLVSYDGRGFFGWQRHGEKPTVQLALERALLRGLGERAAVAGSGRTDRGAHARGQVASFRLARGLDPQDLRTAMNAALPEAVRIREVHVVPDDFDPRADAVSKTYRYVIWNEPELPPPYDGRVWHVRGRLDADAMAAAAPTLVGTHDFTSFATKPNFKQKNTTRTVSRAELLVDRPQLTFEFDADGFLYKMVRNMVRALVKVGEGRWEAAHVARILEARDRKAAPGTAPASGLYLQSVRYARDRLPLPDDDGDYEPN